MEVGLGRAFEHPEHRRLGPNRKQHENREHAPVQQKAKRGKKYRRRRARWGRVGRTKRDTQREMLLERKKVATMGCGSMELVAAAAAAVAALGCV